MILIDSDISVEDMMASRKRESSPETFTLKSTTGAEAAEAMARADRNNVQARAAYSKLLVEQSKSFGAYIRRKVGVTNLQKTG